MRDFTKISPRIWQLRSFQALTPRVRLQYLYLYGGPHQNSAGCSYISDSHACSDLRYKLKEYLANNQMLSDCDLLQCDVETSEVLITDWFKINPPMNEKHKVGTLKFIHAVSSPELRAISLEALEYAWNEKAGRFLSRHAPVRRM
jgi:hypothetical protein